MSAAKPRKFCWSTWLIWLVIVGFLIVSRWLLKSQYLLHQDSVQFALALDRWDILKHQPHPPGYVLYLGLAKLINFVVADQNLVFVIISIIASLIGLWGLVWLANQWWGRVGGFIVGILYVTNASVWFHGLVAEVYIVEMAVAVWVIVLAFRYWKNGWLVDLVLVGLLVGLLGGVRQVGEIALLPLVGYVTWYQNKFRWFTWKWLLGVIVISNLVWLIPLLILSGGISVYWTALSNLWLNTVGVFYHDNQWDVLIKNLSLLFATINQSMPIGFMILGLGVLPYLAVESRIHFIINRNRLIFWLWMFLPSLGLLVFIVVTNPGYALVVIAMMLLLITGAVISIGIAVRRWQPRWANTFMSIAVVGLVGTQIWSFYTAPLSELTYGSASTNTIRDIDYQMDFIKRIAHENKITSNNTIICVGGGVVSPSLRHFQYYLPTFDTYGVFRNDWTGVKKPEDQFIYAHSRDILVSAHQIEVKSGITKILIMDSNLFPGLIEQLSLWEIPSKSFLLQYFDVTKAETREALSNTGLFNFADIK